MSPVHSEKLANLIDQATRRGRRPAPIPLAFTRDLSIEDIAQCAVESEDGVGRVNRIKALRNSHHQVARLLAQKEEIVTIARITGYTPTRINQLKNDPTFIELVSHYESIEERLYEASRADMHARLVTIGFDSIETLHQRLLEEPEKFTNRELLAVLEAAADRTGHGKTSTQNHNVSFGLPDGVLARIREAAASAPTSKVSEENRQALLGLAGGSPQLLEGKAEASWSEGEGAGVREEGHSGAEAPVGAGPDLSPVDTIHRLR